MKFFSFFLLMMILSPGLMQAQLEPVLEAVREERISKEEGLREILRYAYEGSTHTVEISNPVPVKCLLPWLMELGVNIEDHQLLEELRKSSGVHETAFTQHTYFSDRFLFRYDTTGDDAVPTADLNNSGVPDYIEKAAQYAEESWEIMVHQMGYVNPLLSGPYEIRFRKVNYYGTTSVSGGTTFITLHNNYEGFPPNNDPDGHSLGALKVTIAHELKHAIQFATNNWRGNAGSTNWVEVDATMMEEVVYPQVNDYINYLGSESIIRAPQFSIPRPFPRSYGHATFGLYFNEFYGSRFWVQTWERIQQDHFKPMFSAIGESLGFLNRDFAADFVRMYLWHYASGSKGAYGYGFPDSHLFPEPTIRATYSALPVFPRTDNLTNGYSAHFYTFKPAAGDTGAVHVALYRNSPGVHTGLLARFPDGAVEEFIPQPDNRPNAVLGRAPWRWEDVTEVGVIVSNATSQSAPYAIIAGNGASVQTQNMGDVNLDGVVDNLDADIVAGYLAGNFGISNNPLVRYRGDLSGSGSITPLDLSLILEKMESGPAPDKGPRPNWFNPDNYFYKYQSDTEPLPVSVSFDSWESESGDTLDLFMSISGAADLNIRGLSFDLEIPDTMLMLHDVSSIYSSWSVHKSAFLQDETKTRVIFASNQQVDSDQLLRLRFFPQENDSIYMKLNRLMLNDTEVMPVTDSLLIKMNPAGPISTPYLTDYPNQIQLFQNYPNPFNPQTTIRWQLASPGETRIAVYDVLGREVQLLVNDFYAAGIHQVNFDARNLSSGVYIYRLTTPSGTLTRKMILLK